MAKAHVDSLLAKLPNFPGIYKFKNKEGEVLYVGKAISLKKRVTSYFRKQKNRALRTERLVKQVTDIEWVEVGSDWEALMLETNFIKEFRPKYNVLMKDDKNFVYIKITKDEDFPRIFLTRKVEKDKARYFGPKTSAHHVKKTLTLLQKLFMYRSCDLKIDWKGGEVEIGNKTIAYPCLDYHIKRCAAPCIAKIDPETYMNSITQIEYFLEGKTELIESYLMDEIKKLSEARDYEKAALMRDKLLSIQDLMRHQIVTSPDHQNSDIFGFVLDNDKAYFNLFMVRDGKVIDQENFTVDAPGFEKGEEDEATEVMESVLFQYYQQVPGFPREILIPTELEEVTLFQGWVSNQAGHSVSLNIPKRGKKHELLELSKKNALSYYKQQLARWQVADQNDLQSIEELARVLSLKKSPKRIECYDISHLGGTDTVASMVVFENGKAKNSDYRRFRLRSIAEGEIDDFKSMEEILGRRLSRLSRAPKEYKFRKKEVKKDEFLYQLIKNKKVVATVTVHHFKDKSVMITGPFNVYLFKYIAEKIKGPRFYCAAQLETRQELEALGYEHLEETPKRLKSYCGEKNVFALDPFKQKDSSFSLLPDLLVIDGGKGQLSSAMKALKKTGLEIPMISLAKREEEVFLPGKSFPLILPKNSEALKLLQRLRDEAHRFAIQYQKKTRKKYLTASKLDEIPGVGNTIKMKLLKHFGSVENLKNVSEADIASLTGPSLAATIVQHLSS